MEKNKKKYLTPPLSVIKRTRRHRIVFYENFKTHQFSFMCFYIEFNIKIINNGIKYSFEYKVNC